MFRGKTIVAALVFCLAIGSAAWAQDRDRQRDRGDNRQYGVWQQNQRNDHDADDGYYDRNGNWHQRRDRDGDDDRDRDRDRARRNRGWYGNGQNGTYGRNGNYGYGNGNYALNQARQTGFNDGVTDGQNDARTGHSYRPTEDSNYRHANRGWNGQIDRDSYSQAYRNAYLQGYQQGYGGRNGRNGYGYPQGYGWPR